MSYWNNPILEMEDSERLYLCAVSPWIEFEDGVGRYKLLSKIDEENNVEVVLYSQDWKTLEKDIVETTYTTQEGFLEEYKRIRNAICE